MNNDLISRSALLDALKTEEWAAILGNSFVRYLKAKTLIEKIPAVDAVEVVFCDNCTSHNNCVAEGAYRLARIEKPFCCAGKRRDDNAD